MTAILDLRNQRVVDQNRCQEQFAIIRGQSGVEERAPCLASWHCALGRSQSQLPVDFVSSPHHIKFLSSTIILDQIQEQSRWVTLPVSELVLVYVGSP